MKECALLDFDGTITQKDTTRILVRELLRLRPWKALLIVPLIAHFYIVNDRLKKQDIKNKIIGKLLAGLVDSAVQKAVDIYSFRVKTLFRKDFVALISQLQAREVLVLVVTASPAVFVSRSVAELGVEVIGTEFQSEDGTYIDEVSGVACYGDGKPEKIHEWLSGFGEKLDIIQAWSDSEEDLPMMELAAEKCWVNCTNFSSYSLKSDSRAKCVVMSDD